MAAYVVGPDDGFEVRKVHVLQLIEEVHEEVDHDFKEVYCLEGDQVG